MNVNHPENHNIYMSDLAREIVKILVGEKFVSRHFDDVKDNIIQTLFEHVFEFINKHEADKITNKAKKTKIDSNIISMRLIENTQPEQIVMETRLAASGNENEKPKLKNFEPTLDEAKEIQNYSKKTIALQKRTETTIKEQLYDDKEIVISSHRHRK